MKKIIFATVIVSFLSININAMEHETIAQKYDDLFLTVQHGNWEAIQSAWQRCTKTTNVNAMLPDGSTLLHLVAKAGRVNIAETVLGFGADPDFVDANDCTPLYYASLNNDTTMIELLIGPDTDTRVPSIPEAQEPQKLDLARQLSILRRMEEEQPSKSTEQSRTSKAEKLKRMLRHLSIS